MNIHVTALDCLTHERHILDVNLNTNELWVDHEKTGERVRIVSLQRGLGPELLFKRLRHSAITPSDLKFQYVVESVGIVG